MLKYFDEKRTHASIYVDAASVELVTQWILRFMMLSGGKNELLSNNGFRSDADIVKFLGLGAYVYTHELTQQELDMHFHEMFKASDKKIFSIDVLLEKNITKLLTLINLNQCEKDIFAFTMYIHYYEVIANSFRILNDLTTRQTCAVLGKVLNYPIVEIKKALASNGRLSKSGLVSLDKSMSQSLERKLDVLSSEFVDNMMSEDISIIDMIKETVKACDKSLLTLDDFKHLNKELSILNPYLENAIITKQTGVNILLYGKPGTGKTELTKVLAHHLNVGVYEISYMDMDEDPLNSRDRLKGYKVAQNFLKTKPVLLMFDEVEDVFESDSSWFAPKKQKNKAWMNRMLENNTIPTVWITNSLYDIDNAVKRRFDMVIEVPIPPKSKRKEIISQQSGALLTKESLENIAKNKNVAPALISRTAKVINAVKESIEDTSKAFEMVLESTLVSQGHGRLTVENIVPLPSSYDPSLNNTNMDLVKLSQGIKQNPSARLCFYGVPGTGKSAFGKWLAQELDKPFVLKKGSDLISMWVGETEKNIANAFKEASEEEAVLVFDEVDSFLQDRRSAKQSWEVTQVNEMLVQMENYNGIFIATTNLMDGLDQASLRRFDLKLEFGYLKSDQAWKMFLDEAKQLKLRKPTTKVQHELRKISNLAPGDFAAVRRQHRFNPLTNAMDLLARLNEECAVKEQSIGKTMGFLAS